MKWMEVTIQQPDRLQKLCIHNDSFYIQQLSSYCTNNTYIRKNFMWQIQRTMSPDKTYNTIQPGTVMTHHNSPASTSYGVSFENLKFDLSSATVTAALYAISEFNWTASYRHPTVKSYGSRACKITCYWWRLASTRIRAEQKRAIS